MSVDSDNLNTVSQITAEAVDPGDSESASLDPAEDRLVPIATDDAVVIYSAESEIRHPVQLLQNIAADFYGGRELAWRLFLRNLRGMYRQTVLGLFWAFLPPIANTAMWVFLRKAGVFETGETTVDGTVYILTGMILWQSFIDAFQMPLNAISKNRGMISKLNFPRESLLLVGYWEVLFDLCIRLLLLIPAFIFFEVPLHGAIWFAPLAIMGLVLFASAPGVVDHARRFALSGRRPICGHDDTFLDDYHADYLCTQNRGTRDIVELGQPSCTVIVVVTGPAAVGNFGSPECWPDFRRDHVAVADPGVDYLSSLHSGVGRTDECVTGMGWQKSPRTSLARR